MNNLTDLLIVLTRVAGFGDIMHTAMVTRVLRNAGYNAVFKCPEWLEPHKLFCPDLSIPAHKHTQVLNLVCNYEFLYKTNPEWCIIEAGVRDTLRRIIPKEDYDKEAARIDYSKCFPIINYPTKSVKKTNDVLIISKCGGYSNVREYPHFNELKTSLKKNNISYIDANEQRLANYALLDALNDSKLFIGLETGPTMFLSQFLTRENSIVLSSGFVSFNYWGKYYNVDVVERSLPCAPCFIKDVKDCKYSHECMVEILPEFILDKIKTKLNAFDLRDDAKH